MNQKIVLIWPNVLKVALALSAASFLSVFAPGFLGLGKVGAFTLAIALGLSSGVAAGVIWPCVRFEWR